MAISNEPITGATSFTLAELCRSRTAEHLRLDNTPNADEIARLEYLARTVLQPLRDHFEQPIVVNSGFRSEAVNNAVGGSPTSFHRIGAAADIRFERSSGSSLIELFTYVYKSLPFTELIAEELPAGWIHVAVVKGREAEKQTKHKHAGAQVVRAPYDVCINQIAQCL